MARMTTDERRINFICGELGFKPDTVYEFTKMMLNQNTQESLNINILSLIQKVQKL